MWHWNVFTFPELYRFHQCCSVKVLADSGFACVVLLQRWLKSSYSCMSALYCGWNVLCLLKMPPWRCFMDSHSFWLLVIPGLGNLISLSKWALHDKSCKTYKGSILQSSALSSTVQHKQRMVLHYSNSRQFKLPLFMCSQATVSHSKCLSLWMNATSGLLWKARVISAEINKSTTSRLSTVNCLLVDITYIFISTFCSVMSNSMNLTEYQRFAYLPLQS